MYGLLALYYSSIIIEHQPLEMSVIEYFSDGVFNTERLRSGAIEVFNILSGQLIYPSPIFFVDQNNKDLVSLIEFASSIPEISIYKPSLIAHTSIYMITGKYTIYTVDEMLHICSIIQKVLNRSTKTSLTTFKTSAVDLINKINVVCKEDPQKINLESTYKYNEPWHLGEFEEFDTIGEGVYGKITKIKRKLCGMEYVSKVSEDYHIDNFFIETALLKLLANQPNIISMCGFDYGIDKIKIILPLMKGSVYDLIKKDQLDKSKYNKYFHQILLGVEQCHDHDLIHRDIKPANILYDQGTDTMRIIDFGISVCYQSFKNITDTDSANSPDYRSPECFLFENKKYSQEIDVWALGAVFFFMMRKHALIDIYMKHPIDFLNDIFKQLGSPSENEWPGITNKLKEFNISKKDHNPNLSKNLYPFSELILDCLTLNPENRPTVYELLIKHKL